MTRRSIAANSQQYAELVSTDPRPDAMTQDVQAALQCVPVRSDVADLGRRKTQHRESASKAVQQAQREQATAESAVQTAKNSLVKYRDQSRALKTNIDSALEAAGEPTLESAIETTESGAEEYRECVRCSSS